MKLRPYQSITKESIYTLFHKGIKKVVMCKPTGSGKTVTFADIAAELIRSGFKVIVVVDRKELLDQAKEKLISYGLKPSIITGGRRGRLGAECYVATLQTLVNRTFPDVDLIIIDECHKQIFDKIFERPEYKDKFYIGATATPKRSGKMTQLSDHWQELVVSVTIQELLKDGYLVPAITYGAKVEIPKNTKTKNGDWDEKELFKLFNKPKLYDGTVDNYLKFAKGTRGLCFNINIEHSKKTCEAFNAAGISSVHLDGSMDKATREKIIRGHKAGYFDVLHNVDILTTGYDDWEVETVVANLATKSLPKWLQIGGRGGRPTPMELRGVAGHLQKSHFNLIDMGGNVWRMGFWEQEREWSLTHTTKEIIDPAPVKECKDNENGPGCGALIHASLKRCPICGLIIPEKTATPLARGEFLPLDYDGGGTALPADLRGRAAGELPLVDLERFRIAKGYKLGWIVKQVQLRDNTGALLLEYANMREFKNPEGWVRMCESRMDHAEAQIEVATSASTTDLPF